MKTPINFNQCSSYEKNAEMEQHLSLSIITVQEGLGFFPHHHLVLEIIQGLLILRDYHISAETTRGYTLSEFERAWSETLQ